MTIEKVSEPILTPLAVEEDDFPILDLILQNYLPAPDILRIREAYYFAAEAHKHQKRESGEPYIVHPLAVAEILAEFQMDADTIIAGLLHDTIEDTPYTFNDLKERFGEPVANMVQGVTKVSELKTPVHGEETVENLRRMLLATAKDLHVIIIKLADRLHNMRTLQYCPRHKQLQIARDTISIYAPLAHRLGLGRFKWELEDLSLMYLNPDAYREIRRKVQHKRREREQYLAQIIRELDERLKSEGLTVLIEGRNKHFYSIYKKMLRDDKTFEEIYDLTAVRVICETIGECYAVLGEVHTMWRQIEGRFKDYISNPKPNNYRSIHTTVLGPHGRLVEIQLRTQEMHFVAEHGIAAHWRYKEHGSRKVTGKDTKWMEMLQELPDTHDPEEFMQSIRSDLFSEEVYVYTPKGQLVRLPQDATPIDFAYKIHTELGHRCGGAKANGRIIPLNHPLKTGDVVEVLTPANSHPSPAWLDIVKTASARNKIRRYLLESRKEELQQLGLGKLTRELQKAGFNALEFYNTPQAQEVAESLKQKNLEDLFINIGFGRIAPKQVLARLIKSKPQSSKPDKKGEPESDREIAKRSIVRMGDIDDILYRRALCCNPLPGDDIIGFVTRGRGVTIHKSACPNIKHTKDPERILSLFWEGDTKGNVPVSIEITARDRRNLLSDLSQMISSTGTNILGSFSDTANSIARFVFSVEVTSTNHLNTIMQQLLGIEGVRTVKRVRQPHSQMAGKTKAKRGGNHHGGNHHPPK